MTVFATNAQALRDAGLIGKVVMMPARSAAKLIYPGTIKVVHFRFVTFGSMTGGGACIEWIRVPKVEAKRVLRALEQGAMVRVLVKEANREAFIWGKHD